VRYTAGAAVYALSRARALEYEKLQGRAAILAFGGALYDPFVQLTPMLNVHRDLLEGPPREPRPERPQALPAAFRALKIAWADLPGTGDEALRIAARFEGGRALVGADASEERLAAMNASGELARYRRLLFATHGYLSPYDPALSSLVLSQSGNQAPHDGYVTSAELARYRLKSDLVVLSGSHGGFGPVAGSEGLLGLPFALHQAGNHETALSLWTLNDPLTAKLLAQFLERVRAGEGHGAALARAKRALLSDGASPSYWAPLVLHGG
jgi:CHAT domain-containing protein